jgi:hypothetical protein
MTTGFRMPKIIKKAMNMKKSAFLIMVALAVSLSGACAPTIGDSEQAQKNLVAFFEFLNQGDYDKAVELYGGSYEVLIDLNPTLNPDDRSALMKNGCEINGFQCLTVRTADFKGKTVKGEYIFIVHFNDADDNLFIQQTPDAPPVFIFEYRVLRGEDGTYRVLDLPVYVN